MNPNNVNQAQQYKVTSVDKTYMNVGSTLLKYDGTAWSNTAVTSIDVSYQRYLHRKYSRV